MILLPTDGNKLLMQWKGPYPVEGTVGKKDYKVPVKPYASPKVIVKKKDGSNRICIDYRKLNKLTVVDPEPMVSIEDLLRMVSEDKVFSKIDLGKRYWQIPVAEEDIYKTAFITPDGTYEFLHMPFGMVNPGATLVKGMTKLLCGLRGVTSYIDDILIHTVTWEDHLLVLEELLSHFTDRNVTARPVKCLLGTDNIDFVGHWISLGMVGLLEENVTKFKNAPKPRNKKEVRSFVGLTEYYRNFIPNYTTIALPLTDLTKKGQPNRVIWVEAKERAYVLLKSMLASNPILRLPNINKPFILRTNASDRGLGAILMQEYDQLLLPVSYASRKLLLHHGKGMFGSRVGSKEIYPLFVWKGVCSSN